MRNFIKTVSSGQVEDDTAKVQTINFKRRALKADGVTPETKPGYFGNSDSTVASSRELVPGEALTLTYADVAAEASVPLNSFYIFGGEDVDVVAILF